MKSLAPIAAARRAVTGEAADVQDEQRVLALFRDRTELKKAYTQLREEQQRLEDRLKQQQATTERVEKHLELLEQRLSVPLTAYPTMVFFQLRALWNAGSNLLRGYAGELQEQQLEVERRAHHAATNRRQFADRQRAEAALREAQRVAADTAPAVARLEAEIKNLNRPWHMLRRREAAVELMAARARHGESSAALQAAQAQFDEVLAAAELPFPGLSVAARRSINLSLVAYAEVLGARLAGTALLRLATQAAARRDPPASGWSRTQCEQLMTQISVALQSLVGPASSAGEISRRLAELRQVVRYDSDEDAIPTPESVCPSSREFGGPAGAGNGGIPNVLAAGTWGIFRTLLP
jgi:hypothetical protein